MKTIYINGKFLAQRTTGVQRLAMGLLQALDRALVANSSPATTKWVLLYPAGAQPPVMSRIKVREVGATGLGLHFWEQCVLPLQTYGRVLLSFSGSAPLLKRRQVCTMPDAAVFDHPEAYTKAFSHWYRFLFRQLSRRAMSILTISEFSKKRLVSCLGVQASRIDIVRCGAEHLRDLPGDDSIIARSGIGSNRFLLAVGSSNPTKNFERLIHAFSALSEENAIKLIIVGGGNLAVFAEQSAGSGDKRILRLGAVSDAQLKALYRRSTAFLFPSIYEGFGLPPLEAMTCDCPVVASNAASIPEVCADAALYFDPLDVDAMTAAMQQVVDDPKLCETLRTRGRRRSSLFTWDASVNQLLQHLHNRGVLTKTPA